CPRWHGASSTQWVQCLRCSCKLLIFSLFNDVAKALVSRVLILARVHREAPMLRTGHIQGHVDLLGRVEHRTKQVNRLLLSAKAGIARTPFDGLAYFPELLPLGLHPVPTPLRPH